MNCCVLKSRFYSRDEAVGLVWFPGVLSLYCAVTLDGTWFIALICLNTLSVGLSLVCNRQRELLSVSKEGVELYVRRERKVLILWEDVDVVTYDSSSDKVVLKMKSETVLAEQEFDCGVRFVSCGACSDRQLFVYGKAIDVGGLAMYYVILNWWRSVASVEC